MRLAWVVGVLSVAATCPAGCSSPPAPARARAEPVGIVRAFSESDDDSAVAAWRDETAGGLSFVHGAASTPICGSGELACDACGAIPGFEPLALVETAVAGRLGGQLVVAPIRGGVLATPIVLDDAPSDTPAVSLAARSDVGVFDVVWRQADGSLVGRDQLGDRTPITANGADAATSFTVTADLFVYSTADGGLHTTLDGATVAWSAPPDQTACSSPPVVTVFDSQAVFTCEREGGAVHLVEFQVDGTTGNTLLPTDIPLPVGAAFAASTRYAEIGLITERGLESLTSTTVGAATVDLVFPAPATTLPTGIGEGWELLGRGPRGVEARDIGYRDREIHATADVRLDDARCQQN